MEVPEARTSPLEEDQVESAPLLVDLGARDHSLPFHAFALDPSSLDAVRSAAETTKENSISIICCWQLKHTYYSQH
jgi:hypothetical protein